MSKEKFKIREHVTGGIDHLPMVDYHGHQIKVGDKIMYQHCVGRCGMTSISSTTVTEKHYPYGKIKEADFSYDKNNKVLKGYCVRGECFHRHVTWVEIVEP